MSIEDFAEQVAAYVASQGPDFRLNFFVDEVGQYIADNPKLMLNLQTIAESLATKCRGRAWIIVTSQDGLDEIVGEMSKQQGTDFSKIMARFRTRMKLTSTNVDEVIQDRLLKKNDDGVRELGRLYTEQHNNFRTYFGFGEGTRSYSKYPGSRPLHQDLPVRALPGRAVPVRHDPAFGAQRVRGQAPLGGRALAAGGLPARGHAAERRETVGRLATFDLLFDGIRATLKANIQTADRHGRTATREPAGGAGAQGAVPPQVRARVQGNHAQPAGADDRRLRLLTWPPAARRCRRRSTCWSRAPTSCATATSTST